MTLGRKEPYGSLDEERLRSLEEALPGALPADYRAFLVEFNGGEVTTDDNFDEVPGGTWVRHLLGLHLGPKHLQLDVTRSTTADLIPNRFLVIGSDDGGNLFGLDLDGPEATADRWFRIRA